MQKVAELAFKAAATPATILMQGESGTGKESCARPIVAPGQSAGGPRLRDGVSCPSLSQAELLESELSASRSALSRARCSRTRLQSGGGGWRHALSRRLASCRWKFPAEAAPAVAGQGIRARGRNANCAGPTCG